MNRSFFALCVVALSVFVHPSVVVAQAEPSTCVYDPAINKFRAYDAAQDAALLAETFFNRERPATTMLDRKRFVFGETMQSTVDEANTILRPHGRWHGLQWFGTHDEFDDAIIALANPVGCLFEVYIYEPVTHAVWVADPPFQFTYPALVVDVDSLHHALGVGSATGFMMVGHPHTEDDPTRYVRLTIEADCATDQLRILNAKAFAAGDVLHQRFLRQDAWQPRDSMHPAARMLARIACDIPKHWPEATKIESLDEFSDILHAADHAQ